MNDLDTLKEINEIKLPKQEDIYRILPVGGETAVGIGIIEGTTLPPER
jgi:hypothetical protein